MAGRKLTDQEALDRLERASNALGDEPGETVAGQTALTVARSAVSMLMLGLEGAVEACGEEVAGVVGPED